MRLKSLKLVFTLLVLVLPSRVLAQVGSTTDILMGRVAGLDSQAVAGARVEATSVETGITRTKTTGPDGRYTIVFPDGGGNYRLTVRALGMTPVTRNIQRQGDEDRIITDIDMTVCDPVGDGAGARGTSTRGSLAATRARKHRAESQSQSRQPPAS